jgi:hypothetical protein
MHNRAESWEITPHDVKTPCRLAEPDRGAADLGIRRGGIMRTGRAIIISAIIALGTAGSVLASPAMFAAAAGHAPSAQVHTVAAAPKLFLHS